jgi:prophage antirepressor-like protein
MSIILFHFESNEIRFVGTAENPEWIAADICKVLGISNPSQALAILDEDEKGICSADTPGGGQEMLTVKEPGLYFLISKSKKEKAKAFRRWVFGEVLPSVRKTGSYSIEQSRESLEKRFRPVPTTRNRLDAIKIATAGKLSPSYIQRLAIQAIKATCPDAEMPMPTELISLPTARAFLNPTKIAEELGWLCKTGKCSGNAAKVNSLLKELGYQDMIGGRWSATDKAIAANLVDRKPVSTNSRTQKDQLLWSADIISILQEHSVPSPITAC